jgi:enhancer of polycomb-like protein
VRESLKNESAIQSQAISEKRLAFVDLKRKFPSLHDKANEDLLVDKERPSKRPDNSCVFLCLAHVRIYTN